MPEEDEPKSGRWARSDWWGVVLDAPDPGLPAQFYDTSRESGADDRQVRAESGDPVVRGGDWRAETTIGP